MTDPAPPCPECASAFTYEVGLLLVCPMCTHEWTADPEGTNTQAANSEAAVITDAHGTPLTDGDTVTVIKDLKVKGSSLTVKVGTKVKTIRLTDGFAGHDIDCRIDGIGPMQLKSEFVRKS